MAPTDKLAEIIKVSYEILLKFADFIFEKQMNYLMIVRRIMIQCDRKSADQHKDKFPNVVRAINKLQKYIIIFSKKYMNNQVQELSNYAKKIIGVMYKLEKLLNIDAKVYIDALSVLVQAIGKKKNHIIGGKVYAKNNKTKSFYRQHKIQLKLWVEAKKTKKLKKHILHSLEDWVGVKGDGAVITAMNELVKNKDLFIANLIRVNNYPEMLNKRIKHISGDVLKDLCNYYTTHRSKYTKVKNITQVIGKQKVHIEDKFIDLEIEFETKCGIKNLRETCRKIMEAINKIDEQWIHKSVSKLVKSINGIKKFEDLMVEIANNRDRMKNILHEDVFARRSIKQSIVEKVEGMKNTCLEIDPLELEIQYKENSIDALLKLAKEFINMEKKFRTKLREIENSYNDISEIGASLTADIYELIGPSTKYCVKRIYYYLESLVADDLFKYVAKKRFKKHELPDNDAARKNALKFLGIPANTTFYDKKIKNVDLLTNCVQNFK